MNDDMLGCELGIPYPPAKTESKNLYYAALLTNDFAGSVSEMSAVTKYTFQNAAATEKRVSDIMKCISMIEMRHLGFLSSLIKDFGGKPRIAVQSGCNTIYWSAHYISYDTDPRTFLRGNITDEKAAIASYINRINQINDKYVKKLIERIILDEENHIRIFSTILDSYE